MTSEMKIAHLIATNFYGGPEKQIVNHARHISARGGMPYIVTFEDDGQFDALVRHATENGIATATLKSRGSFNPRLISEFASFLRRKEIEILCTHGYKANIVGRLASWMAGVPEIAVSRGWTGESLRVSFYEMLDKLFLRMADHVVAVSDGQRQKVLVSGLPSKSVSVIRNAIDSGHKPTGSNSSLRRELGIPPDAILIASAGRLSPEKNFEGLIEAAKIVCAQVPETYFAVFGEGVLRLRLELVVQTAELEKVFFLPGFRNDLDKIMHEIDIFVLPSWTEGLPNVVLEAFACKKPVVATAVGGTPEVVTHGVSGFLSVAGDVAGLADGLIELSKSSELRSSMGGNGYQTVVDRFDFETQTDQYVELFESLSCRDFADRSEAVD